MCSRGRLFVAHPGTWGGLLRRCVVQSQKAEQAASRVRHANKEAQPLRQPTSMVAISSASGQRLFTGTMRSRTCTAQQAVAGGVRRVRERLLVSGQPWEAHREAAQRRETCSACSTWHHTVTGCIDSKRTSPRLWWRAATQPSPLGSPPQTAASRAPDPRWKQ